MPYLVDADAEERKAAAAGTDARVELRAAAEFRENKVKARNKPGGPLLGESSGVSRQR